MSVINQEITDRYALYNGDSALVMQDIPENSVDYSIYSPPFSSLYTYSNSLNDLSNCKNHDEFFEHYKYIIRENLRITKPGRLWTVHVTNLSTTKANEGYTGLIDFKGEVIERIKRKVGYIAPKLWYGKTHESQRNEQKHRDCYMQHSEKTLLNAEWVYLII